MPSRRPWHKDDSSDTAVMIGSRRFPKGGGVARHQDGQKNISRTPSWSSAHPTTLRGRVTPCHMWLDALSSPCLDRGGMGRPARNRTPNLVRACTWAGLGRCCSLVLAELRGD